MKNEAIFLKCTQQVSVSKTTTPEFYRLYLQSILLCLKEQGVLNDIQVQYSFDILHQQGI